MLSDTRVACCMLWVTMMIVYSRRRSWIRSSMRAVAMGSSAEHGSSISTTSGSTASVRAMHRRCCWPPDRLVPGLSSLSLTSSHSAACRSACSHTSSGFGPLRRRSGLQAGQHVVADRHRRERVRLLEHHADAAAQQHRVDVAGVDVGRRRA